MRIAFISIASCLVIGATSACVDAPITAEHLEADGQLRPSALEQAAFSAHDRARQQAVHISAALASQGEGALEDASEFPADVGAIDLHLRADELVQPRPVLYRWTHGDQVHEVLGVLAPTSSLSLAASHGIEPHQTGTWTVEVLGIPTDGGAPTVLYAREFEVVAAEGG